MDRCIVLVDAGYLLGAAATLLRGDAARSRLSVDHAGLIQQIRERAQTETEQPLLRIYWFDGAPDRVPQPEHRRLRVMPRVTVRLGMLTRVGGRVQQKGVDAAIHAQLTELARLKAASDIVLITGDGDLLPGVMKAKEHGVAMHLWAVQAADGAYNQSEDLVAEADERQLLDRAWLTQAITATEPTPPEVPVQAAPDPSAPSAAPQAPLLAPVRAPTPGDLARSAPAVALRWSSDSGWVDPDDGIPLLESLTTSRQVWVDREQDLSVGGEPHEVGKIFAARWVERLPHDQAADLLDRLDQAHPRIPRSLDSELLRYAARFGTIANDALDISDGHRVQLRTGFWSGIEQSTEALSTPTP
ncbi:NYN domain-containing protein [Streptomyces sp. NBC_01433]|uniref:NYN domain-containing protein n=1 Tax=Streptomyces sp. NBC_01433 TaxID=2903864 RepID=UPI00225338F3|nr:NYN domain-containing protein [Streptomyces sp. NBC_01433]MCX4681307.1 NYN domain-containing protein [Streptomyces sp. NBC_01433]MCX4682384.1 NYN domain-containing protein [Streptomyces sp. NBC_01433]